MGQSSLTHVYRVTWKGAVLGEAAYNVWYYGVSAQAEDLDAFLVAQKEAVWNTLKSIISVKAALTQVDGEGVKGSNEFSSVAPEENGTISGDCLPPYSAWGFTLLRSGAGERNGYKRFAGVPESFQVDGIATATPLGLIPDIQTAIAQDITVGGQTFTPLIRRTVIKHVIQNPPTYWDQGAAVYAGITTQSSRKYGHGI